MELCEELPVTEVAQDQRARIADLLKRVPMFERLSPTQRLELAGKCRVRPYRPRQTVFMQDAPGNDLHVVLDGSVYLVRRLPHGAAQHITTKEAGSAFGEMPFITGEARSLTAISGPGGSMQAVLRRADFEEIMRGWPEIGFTVFRGLLASFGERTEWLPPLFRNYVQWGHRPPLEAVQEGVSDVRIAKGRVLALTGAIGGYLGALFLVRAVALVRPELTAVAMNLANTLSIALVLAGALSGSVVGAGYEWLEDHWQRRQRHARSCANCKFVVWAEASKTPDCIYRRENMVQVTSKPGLRYDTFTDCPSFDSSLPADRDQHRVRADRWIDPCAVTAH